MTTSRHGAGAGRAAVIGELREHGAVGVGALVFWRERGANRA
ncbi:hypothetical protein [Candidatus Amarobacter glycogenicus]